jgi:predicted DNA-binding transcriptional regulator YafY
MARNEQLIRQHKLLQLLEQSRYGRTLVELRDELVESLGLSGLSERTVRRDLEALQAAGFDVDCGGADRGSVWRLGRSLKGETRLAATVTELLALSMGRNLLAPLAGTPYWQGIESLWQKLKQSLPEPVWRHFHRRRQALVVRGAPAKSYEDKQGILASLNRAIAQRRAVRIEYQSLAQSDASPREIEPYALVFHQGSLYVIARLRGGEQPAELRHFKLDRFRKATLLDQRFAPRNDFDPERHFADSLGMFKSGEPQTFRLRVTPRAAAWLAEDPWHPQQQLAPDGDGYAVTIPKAYEAEIIPRVLSLGADAEILAPAAARRGMHALLSQLKSRYE